MRRIAAVFQWLAVVAVLCAAWPAPARSQGAAVFDAGNFAQNVVTAIEAVDQTLTQILEYENQLLQYENMVRNTGAPAVYTWDRIVSINEKLHTLGNQLANYRHWVHDLDDYLQRFMDLDFYRSGQCYASDLSCPGRKWKEMLASSQELHGLSSESQKKTLDWLFRSLEKSEVELGQEAENLNRLQLQAQGAKGHMEAIQAGNQLASHQSQQLMQMRAIMVAQYRAMAAQAQAVAAIEAEQRALSERYRRPMAKPSPPTPLPTFPEMKR